MCFDERLLGVLDRLANADARMRRASNKQLHFEIAMIRAIQSLDEVQISDVIRSLKAGNPAEANPVASLQAQPAETPPVVQAPSSEASSNPPSTARSSARAKKKSRGVENQLESLIEQAPENHPEPAAPNSEGSAGESIPKELPSPAAAEANETGAPKDQDAFYDDPLVREALDIFKGKLKD